MVATLSPMASAIRPAPHVGVGRLLMRIAGDRSRPPPQAPDPAGVSTAFAEALSPLLDPSDPAVWVVRRLELRTRSGTADAAGIVAAMAAALRAAVARVLRGETVDGVVRFADRGAWLAALLWDHARGDARGRWGYARFAYLDALPREWVPRQLFAAEPDMVWPVLVRLHSERRLVAWLGAIGEKGARGVEPFLFGKHARGGASGKDVVAALVHALMRAVAAGIPVESRRAALFAVVECLAGGSIAAAPNRTALLAARTIAAARVNRAARPADTASFTSADPRRAEEAAAASRPDMQRPGYASHRRHPAHQPRDDKIVETAYAGVVLLWRSVRALEIDTLLDDDAGGARARLTLAACLAGPNRETAWADPALHWLTGFSPGARDRPLAGDAKLARRFVNHMVDRARPGCIDRVTQQCGGLAVVQDMASEDWLALTPRRAPARRIEAMRDPAVDIDFFGVSRSRGRRPWVVLARAAYADLGRRLTGLERSSAAWLWTNVLAGWGQLVPGDEAQLLMPSVPLDLVLRMTGLEGTRFVLGDGRAVTIHLPGAA